MLKKVAVSVIIPVYNRSREMEDCLKSVISQKTTFNYEVIVVDDGSTDNTASVINQWKRRYPSKIRILAKDKNEGASKAINSGIAKATGKIIALVDSDCIAKSDWLENITSYIRRGDEKITAGYSEGEVKNAWQKIIQESYERTRKNSVKDGYMKSFDTKNAAAAKDVFNKVGFFRVRHNYDIDFGARCSANDIKIKHVSNAVVKHKHRTSLRAVLKNSYWYYLSYASLIRRNPRYLLINPGDNVPFIAGFLFLLLVIGAPIFLSINAAAYLFCFLLFIIAIVIKTWHEPYYLVFHRLLYHVLVSTGMFLGFIMGIPKALMKNNQLELI